MFLAMLARLEKESLLGKDSEIKNLGLIMGLFMGFASDGKPCGLMEWSDDEETIKSAKYKKKWNPNSFANHILAYARKYDIDLVSRPDMDKLIDKASEHVDLPVPDPKTKRADPFGFAKALQNYEANLEGIKDWMTFAISGRESRHYGIGGDNFDITTWSSAARKEKAFDKKDPLEREQINALKKGLVIYLGLP